MAEDSEKPKSETPAESKASEALPVVEAPSISPAEAASEAAPAAAEPVALDPAKAFTFSDWLASYRVALLVVFMLASALIGGAVGAVATAALARDTSGAEARQAMQAALTRLTMEIAGLKDNLAAAEKSARAQNARLADLDTRVREKLARDQTLVTGSIAAPKTAAAPAAAPAPAPVAAAPTPLPQPRPALAEASPRSFVAEGWSVLGMRRGFLYVQNGRDVFRVLPGARLPGLGIVEDIRREDGEWIVVTRRGVIPAGRERL